MYTGFGNIISAIPEVIILIFYYKAYKEDNVNNRNGVALGFKIRTIFQFIVGLIAVIFIIALGTELGLPADFVGGFAGIVAGFAAIFVIINYYFFTVVRRWAKLIDEEWSLMRNS